jgi:hypothetical protein
MPGDPWLCEHPEVIDRTEDFFTKIYQNAGDDPGWQDLDDRAREIFSQSRPLIERFEALGALLSQVSGMKLPGRPQ